MIERVENWQLWNTYAWKRAQIISCLGIGERGVNEALMFHGSTLENIGKIAAGGFNPSLSKENNALGKGVYDVSHIKGFFVIWVDKCSCHYLQVITLIDRTCPTLFFLFCEWLMPPVSWYRNVLCIRQHLQRPLL